MQTWDARFLPWSKPREECLLVHFNKGDSFSKIAAELGITRSAAIGKAHRMGLHRGRKAGKIRTALPRKRSPEQNAQRRQTHALRKIKFETLFGPKVEPLPDMHDWEIDLSACKQLIALGETDCRWPVGESPYVFCGKEKFDNALPYCIGHCRLAYRGPW